MEKILDSHGIILFDGICNFCNRTVDFISRKDRRDYFRFASLQSETGASLLQQFHIPPQYNDSIVFIEGTHAWQKSDAFCRIMRRLPGGWKAGYAGIMIPRFLRDAIYDLVARHRYQWFGKRDSCRVPSAEERKKFLE